MRLIDADALNDDILKSAVMIDDRGIQTGYEIAIELIKRQPTIDAVPVIRCKDCKNYEYDHVEKVYGIPLIVAHEICKRWGEGRKTSENGWCFLAERKDNG